MSVVHQRAQIGCGIVRTWICTESGFALNECRTLALPIYQPNGGMQHTKHIKFTETIHVKYHESNSINMVLHCPLRDFNPFLFIKYRILNIGIHAFTKHIGYDIRKTYPIGYLHKLNLGIFGSGDLFIGTDKLSTCYILKLCCLKVF